MTLADLDRVIEAVEATLDRVPYTGETAEGEAESFVVVTKLPYGDVVRARDALTLLRQMREGAVESEIGIGDAALVPDMLKLDGSLTLFPPKWFGEGAVPALLILAPEETP